MKFSYQFSNLFGTVYRGGDILFSPDGNTVLSPVGNKISLFDLKNHRSETLPVESRYTYTTADLATNGISLLAVNEDGEIHFISLISRTILHRLRTNRHIHAIKFSPDCKHFAITKETNAFVYRSPGPHTRDYSSFAVERVLKGAYDDTVCLAWSSCSRILAVGSRDMTVRVYALQKFENMRVYCLGGMSDPVVGAFFEADSLDMYSVSRGGQLAIWESSIEMNQLVPLDDTKIEKKDKKKKEVDEDEISEIENKAEEIIADENSEKNDRMFYKRAAKHFLRDHLEGEGSRTELTCADFHQSTRIFVTGFSNGAFLLLSLPDCSLVHSLAISEQEISSVKFNISGDWVALGCPDMGQLLVWEWQSETYVMKQQGHGGSMSCLTYSPDGSFIATGGDDAKVKLWNTSSGFCFVTFSEHEAKVSGLAFTPNGKVVLSSSLDGTVRAFDMTRYRNFKTLTTPRPVQLGCVSVDSSGDLVAGGGIDVFEVYIWSLTTGRLTEVLSGHEGPVGGLAFSPALTSTQLATVSWDKSLRIWDAIESSGARETIALGSDGLAVAWRPDGQTVSVATLSGQIQTFDVRTGSQTGTIEGKKDLGAGRSDEDKISAKKKREKAHFSSLCYSADGTILLAGGESKHICIYHVHESLLLKKFEVTQNRSFQGMDETINRRKMTEFGVLSTIEDRDQGTQLKLAGSKTVDMSSRNLRLEVRVSALQFSPTGRSFSAISTEGLLVYSLDRHLVFDPVELEIDITPSRIRHELSKNNYLQALLMALKLNERGLIRQSLECVPHQDVMLLAKQLSVKYVSPLLQFVAEEAESSRHVQFYLVWTRALLLNHGTFLKAESKKNLPVLNLLIKNLTRKSEDLGKVCDHNKYRIDYLKTLSEIKKSKSEGCDDDAEEMDEVGGVKEVASDEDSDDNMEELAAKWSDED